MTTATIAAITRGAKVRFLQEERTARIRDKKTGVFEYAHLPNRTIEGTVTSVSRGNRSTQVTVKGTSVDEGSKKFVRKGSFTAHLQNGTRVQIID